MRIILTLLLILTLIPAASASSLEERLSAVALIDQNAEAYKPAAYKYNGAAFVRRGCGPASIANALCALFDVREQEEADALLLESMKLFTNSHQPAREIIDIKRMERLAEVDPAQYPVLSRLLDAAGAQVVCRDGNLSPDLVSACLDNRGDSPLLLLCRISLTDQWADVVSVCENLLEAGHNDALLLAVYVSAGPSSTVAPFRGGDSGHYISVALSPDELLERCAFYVLDSDPRALPGEAFGKGEAYDDRYTLVRREGRLPYDFALTHLQRGVVAASLKEARLTALEALSPDEAAAQRLAWLREMLVFGRAACIIYVP
ncbi:MAG: hypothetical protein IKP40_08135 [Clostridia bacterium]|nr:hypothetical protein [Clostridia bacterium]